MAREFKRSDRVAQELQKDDIVKIRLINGNKEAKIL